MLHIFCICFTLLNLLPCTPVPKMDIYFFHYKILEIVDIPVIIIPIFFCYFLFEAIHLCMGVFKINIKIDLFSSCWNTRYFDIKKI